MVVVPIVFKIRIMLGTYDCYCGYDDYYEYCGYAGYYDTVRLCWPSAAPISTEGDTLTVYRD